MKSGLKLALLAALALLPPAVGARDFVMKPPPTPFEIKVWGPFSEDAVPSVWPATFVFKGINGHPCSATAIGERVILTAAHCIRGAAQGSIEAGSKPIEVSCMPHPSHPGDYNADFSLCLAGSRLAPPKGGFESLSMDPAAALPGKEVRLLGFGCRSSAASDDDFGKLSQGEAIVLAVDPGFLEVGGGDTICAGDSGSGAYVSSGDYRVTRLIVGVNAYTRDKYSRLARIATPVFSAWAKQWADERKVTICGLHAKAANCRK